MGSPAQAAQPDSAQISWVGLGLHVGPGLGLILEPECRVGPGLYVGLDSDLILDPERRARQACRKQNLGLVRAGLVMLGLAFVYPGKVRA
jgi:hypothetical protein